ncbi:MAG: glycosyltransferase family 4 protein [Christensenellaceae bacterium]
MRVLNISNDYDYSNVYSCLQKALIDSGVDSYFFVPTCLNFHKKIANDKIIYAPSFRKADRLLYFRKQSKIYNKFKPVIEILKPDLLHGCFVFSNGYLCLRAKRELDIPYVVSVQNTDVNVFFKYMIYLRKLGVKILLNAERIVFISPQYRDFVVNKYIAPKDKDILLQKSVILPFALDEFWINHLVNKPQKSAIKHINILCVGTIEKNKNQANLAEAIAILRNHGYDISLTLVGTVVDKHYSKKLDSYSFITNIGKLSKEKLIEEYRKANIFVLASHKESFGLVYAEALTQGLPIIYSRGQGFDGQFSEGYVGYHVESDSPDSIATGIIHILENYSEISQRCAEVSRRFAQKHIAEEYNNLYRDILT